MPGRDMRRSGNDGGQGLTQRLDSGHSSIAATGQHRQLQITYSTGLRPTLGCGPQISPFVPQVLASALHFRSLRNLVHAFERVNSAPAANAALHLGDPELGRRRLRG
jgi:hypothetical protein